MPAWYTHCSQKISSHGLLVFDIQLEELSRLPSEGIAENHQ
jgi:hypothetical protein